MRHRLSSGQRPSQVRSAFRSPGAGLPVGFQGTIVRVLPNARHGFCRYQAGKRTFSRATRPAGAIGLQPKIVASLRPKLGEPFFPVTLSGSPTTHARRIRRRAQDRRHPMGPLKTAGPIPSFVWCAGWPFFAIVYRQNHNLRGSTSKKYMGVHSNDLRSAGRAQCHADHHGVVWVQTAG
jgi:hypothetical protein